MAQITTSGKEWLDESLDESASPVWMPRVDAEALEAMRMARQDSRSDAQLGAKQLDVAVCVGYAKPLLLKAFRLFTPGRPGADSYLDTGGFEFGRDGGGGGERAGGGRGLEVDNVWGEGGGRSQRTTLRARASAVRRWAAAGGGRSPA